MGCISRLVSSDALARGIDVPGIKLVVSYELPKYVKGYIHRAGRTGRGGNAGTAVSLLQANQISQFTAMLAKVGKAVPKIEKIELDRVAEFEKYESHLEILQNKLSSEQKTSLNRIKSHKRKKSVKSGQKSPESGKQDLTELAKSVVRDDDVEKSQKTIAKETDLDQSKPHKRRKKNT